MATYAKCTHPDQEWCTHRRCIQIREGAIRFPETDTEPDLEPLSPEAEQ